MIKAMSRSKKMPTALTEKQELQRQQTINKVLHATEYLISQGMNFSIKNLMDCTGLSRSVFAKSHVRAVIEDYYQSYEEAAASERKHVAKKAQHRDKIHAYEDRNKRLVEENTALKEECSLLRGRLFLLMQCQQE
jgi:hypothetical protein